MHHPDLFYTCTYQKRDEFSPKQELDFVSLDTLNCNGYNYYEIMSKWSEL